MHIAQILFFLDKTEMSPRETYVITNYDCYRVWVWVDKHDGLVTKPPIIG
ncbi:hypothetical protein D8674_010348 [Pyrus ussuriensis x Pyrus communis]|uniref:Uncharacterized protein n=1 Tax=Pyrus ussuriensis x Pyrus communis TaxID=2448454 RepID=A0A5N5FAT0_9ROSA|nr:hypothetical protein D8674_010348 [Pyrus ussuriensis x Pyrus communis]